MACNNNIKKQKGIAGCSSKKTVHFSQYSTLKMVPPYSEADILASWYSKNDIDNFKRRNRRETFSLRQTAAAKEVKDLALCVLNGSEKTSKLKIEETKGLEDGVSERVSKLILLRRKLSVAAVMKEQAMQKAAGVCDTENLAREYRKQTQFSREWSAKKVVARAA